MQRMHVTPTTYLDDDKAHVHACLLLLQALLVTSRMHAFVATAARI
jgi:hypothetical protein